MLRSTFLALSLLALLAAAHHAAAQQIHLPPNLSQPQGTGSVPTTSGGDDVQQKQAEAANAQRQIEIRRDTDKMFELTQELKDYLQNSNQGVMSVDAIKKAEQIEKLAHSVKSKMKQAF
jgi:hypothetical protein